MGFLIHADPRIYDADCFDGNLLWVYGVPLLCGCRDKLEIFLVRRRC